MMMRKRWWTMYLMAVVIAVARPAAAQLPPAGPPPYIGTPAAVIDVMLRLGEVGPDDVVYDLGSGDGRIVLAAAQLGARAVGIEYDAELVRWSWARADSAGLRSRVDFRHQDLFEADLREASVVMLYLGAEFNVRLRPRLLEQLDPGDRVVSHGFHMDDWEPDSTVTIGTGPARATVFQWVIPADLDGFWFLEIEGIPGRTLELRQTYQRLAGTVGVPGSMTTEVAGEVRGAEVEFEAEGLRFAGALSEDGLAGTVRLSDTGSTRRWTAVRFGETLPRARQPSPGVANPWKAR